MAGHNKWSQVNRLKGALNVRRGTLLPRFSREMMCLNTGDDRQGVPASFDISEELLAQLSD